MTVSELFVKVCGITRTGDAELAVELGVSAIGLIFWPGSPRYIEPDAAREITNAIGSRIATVGVFVNESAKHVNEIAERAGVSAVQLHGSESPEYCREIRNPVIKAIGLGNGATPALAGFDDDVVMLLDAHDPKRYGGTGRTVDWATARKIAATRRTILSGGLNAKNIRDALAAAQPYGVDVSSGVETAPGIKDAAKMRQFFEVLHG